MGQETITTECWPHTWVMSGQQAVCSVCGTNPTLWVRKPDGTPDVLYKAQPHQEPYHESALPNLIMIGPRGTGKTVTMRFDAHMRALAVPKFTYLIMRRQMPELKKALALDTPIPTPTGWTTMGKLKVGQHVYAPDGSPTKIVWKSRPHIDPEGTYKIRFDNGESVVASANHKWRVKSRSDRSNKHPPIVVTTQDMAHSVWAGEGRLNYSIALAQAWRPPSVKLPVDPYVLGVWLGDGTSGQGAFTSVDLEIVNEVMSAGYPVVKRPAHKYEWSIRGLMVQLRDLGILWEKRVPQEYEHGSYDQRLSLLQGLMDTDGCCSKDGWCSFSQVGKRRPIVEVVFRLAASFGLKPRRFTQLVKQVGTSRYSGEMLYGVHWTGDVPVFRLTRKLVRLRAIAQKGSKAKEHYIASIQQVEDTLCQCIAVAHPSHEYLVGHASIPTHNSHLRFVPAEMKKLGGYYHHTDAQAHYPNGSTGFYGHADTEKDMLHYLSAEYDMVIADEVTTFSKEIITKMLSCVRVPEGSGRIGMMRGGTNKLGPGAEFVRQYFVDKNVPIDEDEDYHPEDWGVIDHQWGDNKYTDIVQYRKRMAPLPEHVRRAWLDNEWVIEGAYFTDFRPTKESKPWHVIQSLPLYKGISILSQPFLSIYRAIDWGYHPDPAVCLWIAVLPNKRAIVFKERTWKETLAADVAKQIKRESEGMRVIDTFCDPTMVIQTGQNPYTIGDIFEQNGVPLTPSVNKRELYGYAIHNYLNTIIDESVDETHPNLVPQLQILAENGIYGCPKLIKTLPMLRMGHPDPTKIADGDDHWAVALAYFCMGQAMPSADPQVSTVPKWMRPRAVRRLYA